MFSDNPVSYAMAMLVMDLMLMSKRRMRNCCKESFCPERALSVRMFRNFLEGGQRHISKLGDLEAEQGIRFMGVLQRLYQDPSAKQEVPGMFFCVCD